MREFVERNSLPIGALAAAGFFVMQLSNSGAAGYEYADILSVLLIAVPVAVRSTRPRQARAGKPPAGDGDDGTAEPTGANRAANDDVDLRAMLAGPSADDTHTGDPGADQAVHPSVVDEAAVAVRTVEQLLVRVVLSIIAAAAWMGAVIFALVQTWPPVLAALVIFAIATIAFPSQRVERQVVGAAPSRR